MKLILLIATFVTLTSCAQGVKQENKVLIDPNAQRLNDSAVALASTSNHDKKLEAVKLLDKATEIQPDYYLAHWNKMAYQNELGLTKDAFLTLKKLEELRPEYPDLKVIAGIFLELNKDSLKARNKFLEADKIYQAILDTLSKGADPYQTTLMNKAVNLKFLGREKEGNEILAGIQQGQTDENLRGMIEEFIRMSRRELMESFKSPK